MKWDIGLSPGDTQVTREHRIMVTLDEHPALAPAALRVEAKSPGVLGDAKVDRLSSGINC